MQAPLHFEPNRGAFEHGRRIHREICAALKSTEVHHGDEVMASGHVIGTYRMGFAPKELVVNPTDVGASSAC